MTDDEAAALFAVFPHPMASAPSVGGWVERWPAWCGLSTRQVQRALAALEFVAGPEVTTPEITRAAVEVLTRDDDQWFRDVMEAHS